MRSLSDLEPEEIASLADEDFQEIVQSEARSHADLAIDTYVEVAERSDDDAARVKAADRILAIGGFQEKQSKTALPLGVSEEVFKIALAGLGHLAGIAQSSSSVNAILRNVTPAKTDPRPFVELKDDSPMNRQLPTDDNDAIVNVIAGERYEIIERKRNPD
jgi:hypothetical protein